MSDHDDQLDEAKAEARWPRWIWACLEPGCHYLERYHRISSSGPWPSCPGHPWQELVVASVEPAPSEDKP